MTSGERDITLKEHFYQLTFDADKVTNLLNYFQRFTHLGRVWRCYVSRHGPNDKSRVEYLSVSVFGTVSPMIAIATRIVKDHLVHTNTNLPDRHTGIGQYSFCKVIDWSKLLDKFCTDGKFTLEIGIQTPSEQHLTAIDHSPSHNAPMKLENAIFTDVQVACNDSEETIDCNRNIICQASTAMLAALANPRSKKSKERKFTIGHDCATVENVLLLVKCMYEGWLPDEMDSHAAELYLLADCYGCDRIAVMANDSIERNLTLSTFWKIATTAVFYHHPILLHVCATFAKQLPNGVDEVLNLDELGSNDTIAGVTVAVANLNKKK